MSQDSIQPAYRRKCAQCGLVNAGSDDRCRRCGAPFVNEPALLATPSSARPGPKIKTRSFLNRVAWVAVTTLLILIVWYVSLLLSSSGLQSDQQQKVAAAISLLQQQGFTREAFILKHLTAFRATDNWLNSYVGHRDAYAATNFPFEIVTLYPDFFLVPVDDRERAAVLLHEARHLMGDGEEAALYASWHEKRRLGWTADKYQQTRVWDATERLTRAQFPYMFQCGPDGKSDCF